MLVQPAIDRVEKSAGFHIVYERLPREDDPEFLPENSSLSFQISAISPDAFLLLDCLLDERDHMATFQWDAAEKSGDFHEQIIVIGRYIYTALEEVVGQLSDQKARRCLGDNSSNSRIS